MVEIIPLNSLTLVKAVKADKKATPPATKKPSGGTKKSTEKPTTKKAAKSDESVGTGTGRKRKSDVQPVSETKADKPKSTGKAAPARTTSKAEPQSQSKLTRTQAKGVHKDLPPGGVWRTISGNHVYIKDGQILAGAGVKAGQPVKLNKKELAAHFADLQKEGAKKNETKKGGATKRGDAPAGDGGNAGAVVDTPARKRAAKTADDGKPGAEAAESVKKPAAKKKAEPKLTVSNQPSEETIQSTRKFKAGQFKEWFTSLPTSEQRKVWAMNAKASNYRVGMTLGTSAADAQKILDAFHDLRAKAGLSKTKAGKETSKKGVKDTRHQRQDNREVAYDVGEKIGGARKDLATLSQRFEADPTAQDLESLEAEYPEAAQKLVTKKTLLKPLDWEAERDNGVDVNVAMAKKLIYDRIATEPAKNTPLDRMLYFNGMRNIQRLLEPLKTFDEFKNAISDIGRTMRMEAPRELQQAERSLAYAKEVLAKNDPSNSDLERHGATFDRSTFTWTVPKDAKKKWQESQKKRVAEMEERLERTRQANQNPMGLPLGEKLFSFFTDYESRDRTWRTVLGKRLTWEKYFEDKANKPTRTSEGGDGERTLRPGEERAKIPLDKAKRVGGKKVNVQKPEDMVKSFGFRGVEFGNYVDDESGKHHLVKASEAFQDLSEILGLEPKDVSLNGRLGMAFGARGKGGALAHYEPMSKVINMTRDAGAGTLAHEWGHALDNILHAESTGTPSIGFASDSIGTEGSGAVRDAYAGLMDAMLKGDGKEYIKPDGKNYNMPYDWKEHHNLPWAEAFAKVRKSVDADFERQVSMNEHYYARDASRLRLGIEKAKEHHQKSLLNRYHALASLYRKHGKEAQVPDFERPTGKSQFATAADALCKGKQGYWNRKHEMFARAFESYTLDRLGAAKRQNDYLVAGTTDPRTYPQGHERELINKHFDKLFEAVRGSGAIQKGLEADLQKALFNAEDLRKMADQAISGETKRYAYEIAHTVDPSEVLYIPVNRLNMIYQTDEATNWDKVKENIAKMQAGEALEPVVIGYDYDVHDGHHRWLGAKALDHTHVPCIVGGTDELRKQEALEKYRELWKSMTLPERLVKEYRDELQEEPDVEEAYQHIIDLFGLDQGEEHDFRSYAVKAGLEVPDEWVNKSIVQDPTGSSIQGDDYIMYRGIGQRELDNIHRTGFVQTKGKGNDDDKGKTKTCFTVLFQQAEGYARSQYDQYGEKAAYVIALPRPPWVYEDEHGELVSEQPVPFGVGVIIPVPDPDAVRDDVLQDGEALA